MTQFPRLSNREQEVVQLLLEGKSNKSIASSLSISDRTVEFHLKNIYDKFQVGSRIELVLKLGNAPGRLEAEKPVDSTVAGTGEVPESRGSLSWDTSLREAVSIIGKELRMENALNSNTRSGADATTFFGAIRVCLAKYADFNGQARRPEFWWFTLFVVLVASALTYLSEVLGSVFLIAMLLPFLAAGTRRLRDSGKSGWLQLYLLIPFAGLIMLGIMWAKPSISPLPEATPPA